jgi:hypothetical protein
MASYKAISTDDLNITQEELDKMYAEAHSNIEAPILGRMYTPLCKSCKKVNMVYGSYKAPECSVYDKLPEDYIDAVKSDCPHYEKYPDSKWKPRTEDMH